MRKKTSEFEKNARKTYKQQLKRLNFTEYDYYGEVAPCSSFYKFLCKVKTSKSNHETLKIPIPDTIVYNDSGLDPYWLYSDNEGFIRRTSKFADKDIIRKMGNPLNVDEAAALIKTP